MTGVKVGRASVSWLCARLQRLAEGRGEEGQAGLNWQACIPGVLMPLADPCAHRELDRKACLIHESPAEVLWGFWLHCPFSVKRAARESDHPRALHSTADHSNVGMQASASLPWSDGIIYTSNFAVVVKDGKLNPV